MKSRILLAAMGMMIAVAATGCGKTYEERTIEEGTVVEQKMIVE